MMPVIDNKLILGLEEQFTGRRDTLTHASLSDYFITNLTVSSRGVFKGLELSASVYNLFDRQYAAPAGADYLQDRIRQDGRSFRVKATYAF